MNPGITEILASQLTAKKKAKALADALSDGTLDISAFIKARPKLSGPDLATVVESLEAATRKKPELVDAKLFSLLVKCLGHAAPRVRWEAARTIGNTAGQHSNRLGTAVAALLANTSDNGTVVRWATAQALAAILRLGYPGKDLPVRIEKLAASEKDAGVRGVYEKALRGRR